MGRGKVEVKRIENRTNRQVTFSKRRQGLLKKADELSILCDAQIGLIIFSPTKRVYTYPNHNNHNSQNLEHIIQKYLNHEGLQLPVHNNQEEMYQQVEGLREAIRVSEQNMRLYLAEDIPPVSLEELHKHEQQLECSLNVVRARKKQLMDQQLNNLSKKEQMLQAENSSMYSWLMGAEQDQPELSLFFGNDQPSSSTTLQLGTSSSSPQFYPYPFPSANPYLQGYGPYE